jgi:acyl dehydratase
MSSVLSPDPSRLIYLDDLQAGQRFIGSDVVLNEKEMIEFAQRFDPQSFHTDPEAAKSGFFGGLIGSGWLTSAITMRMLVESFPIAGGNIGLGGSVEWPLPTRPGDVLHVEGEVIEVKPSKSHPDRGVVTVRIETKNQRREAVQILTAKMLAFKRKK